MTMTRERLEEIKRVMALKGLDGPAIMDLVDAAEESIRLREALQFYAHREHYFFDGEPDDWDTISGELQNWLYAPTIPAHDKDFKPNWMIEGGGIARAALKGKP